MGTLLLIVGVILCLIGGIWLLVEAFKESVLWGLGSIFVPFVSLIFAIMHWSECKVPFLMNVVGFLLLIAGSALSAPTPPAG